MPKNKPVLNDKGLFWILSLSGGGIRGLYQATFLREFLTTYSAHKPLWNKFQVIAGTSTGSIIAVGLALDIGPDKIAELFEKHARLIFPPRTYRRGQSTIRYLWGRGPMYKTEPLKKALESVLIVPSKPNQPARLAHCKTTVMLPAVVLDNYGIRAFGNYSGAPGARVTDNPLNCTDVVLASCAAPTYFSAVLTKHGIKRKAEDSRHYVDGGLWANNPAFMAVMEAYTQFNIPFEKMRVVSVGNGEIPDGVVGTNFNSMRRGFMTKPILNMLFAAQSEVADEAVERLIGEEHLLRINVKMSGTGVALDDANGAMTKLAKEALTHGRGKEAKKLDRFLKTGKNRP